MREASGLELLPLPERVPEDDEDKDEEEREYDEAALEATSPS